MRYGKIDEITRPDLTLEVWRAPFLIGLAARRPSDPRGRLNFYTIRSPLGCGYWKKAADAFSRCWLDPKRTPRVLILGGGGCEAARLIALRRPDALISVVESDADVLTLRARHFPLPKSVVIWQTDALSFLEASREWAKDEHWDFCLIDLYDAAADASNAAIEEAAKRAARNVVANDCGGKWLTTLK